MYVTRLAAAAFASLALAGAAQAQSSTPIQQAQGVEDRLAFLEQRVAALDTRTVPESRVAPEPANPAGADREAHPEHQSEFLKTVWSMP